VQKIEQGIVGKVSMDKTGLESHLTTQGERILLFLHLSANKANTVRA
jgi:hypothetical protein